MKTAFLRFGLCFAAACVGDTVTATEVDLSQQARSILSNKCFACHGPDEGKLEAGLRLDKESVATHPIESGNTAIVPGQPDASELLIRITSKDPDVRMPPASFAKPVSDAEAAILRRWIEQGATFATHWSYIAPAAPQAPQPPAAYEAWPKNQVDRFVLARMLEKGLRPNPEADRVTLARRLFLDLTGLPPTVAEVDAFVSNTELDAYETLVEDLLRRPAYGEHWARQWLDLARYADSAGYADDPVRTIWAYRDWVIRAFQQNMPFDQFTREQIAGDLLPSPTEDQRIATAFHRNTMTNSEGGTNDEEFRNVAVVDRVNTTLAVWMGTTMACAECHTHKYDPITQAEYFSVFAIFNNTEDMDRKDEAPVLEVYSPEQKQRISDLTEKLAAFQKVLDTPTAELAASQSAWEDSLSLHNSHAHWIALKPSAVTRESGSEAVVKEDVVFIPTASKNDTYTVDIPLGADPHNDAATAPQKFSAIRLETLADASLPGKGSGHGGGNFVITQIKATLVPPGKPSPQARFVRIEIPGKRNILSLAEVQVYSEGKNLAIEGTATQSSTAFSGDAQRAIDGNTDGNYASHSVTHSETSDDPWWELDLGSLRSVDKLVLWNRTDGALHVRLKDFRWQLLNEQRENVYEQTVEEAPNPAVELTPSWGGDVVFKAAFADFQQDGFPSASVLNGKKNENAGWAVGGSTTNTHGLVMTLEKPLVVQSPTVLRLVIEQNSQLKKHLLGKFRIQATADENIIRRSKVPPQLLAILDQPYESRAPASAKELSQYYREDVAPELAAQRAEWINTKEQLAKLKPQTSVPIARELAKDRRSTHVQFRGNYLDKGPEVQPGVPSTFPPIEPSTQINRLVFADWLVDRKNPLTARVLANRYWETLFGRGIVATSEEFGSQGELPTHPELLDFLATDVMDNHWNLHALLKQIVLSATYRQSSQVTPEQLEIDRDNFWLARGPRVRLSAEMVRDQSLAVSGLLSPKMYGPPVKPPQPNLGLTAAFGSSTDWQTSEGEDRHRRALYTTWRRSNPYPSMATFDAPNREVCTIRRSHSNTPLQSLVTLNDPAYVEAAQALARATLISGGTTESQIGTAFRKSLLRSPTPAELTALVDLYEDSREKLAADPDAAKRLATEPIGELPKALSAVDAAAMTVVSNVLLNLDEMFLKR